METATRKSNNDFASYENEGQPRNKESKHPEDFSVITAAEIESGVWVPVDRSLRVMLLFLN